jgi:hypothetical protein
MYMCVNNIVLTVRVCDMGFILYCCVGYCLLSEMCFIYIDIQEFYCRLIFK